MNWSSSSNPKDIIRRYRICPEQKIGRFKCFGEDNQRFIWPINNKDYRLVPSQYMRVDGDAVYTLKNIWSTAITDKPLPKSGRFYFEMESIGGNNVNFIGLVKKNKYRSYETFCWSNPRYNRLSFIESEHLQCWEFIWNWISYVRDYRKFFQT